MVESIRQRGHGTYATNVASECVYRAWATTKAHTLREATSAANVRGAIWKSNREGCATAIPAEHLLHSQ